MNQPNQSPDFKNSQFTLIPTIVTDFSTNQVLMLAYVNQKSYQKCLSTGETWFWSRSRNELWHKGATSGNTQKIKNIKLDCDQDTLLFEVIPNGPACHTGNQTCFYQSIETNEE